MKQNAPLRRATFRYIESELYAYKSTHKEIKQLREQIVFDGGETDENVGGGRSNLPGQPTEQIATKLLTHKTLQNLVKISDAITETFEEVSDDHRYIIDLKYFKNPNLYWDDVAYKLNMHRNTVFKYRREFIIIVANKLGMR